MITLTLPNHRALSWNMLYKTPHWAYRSMIAKDHHDLVKAACIDADIDIFTKKDIVNFPVNIHFVAHYKDHPVDCSNICTKIYEDGLKDILLTDDDPEHVKKIISESVKDTHSYLEIFITKHKSIDNDDIV